MTERLGREAVFQCRVVRTPEGFIEAVWEGHADLRAMYAFYAELDQATEGLEDYLLLVDVRGLSGYDPETKALARCWSGTPAASRALIIAVVADSQLVAAESPATAMAAPRRARWFGALAAARTYLTQRIRAPSGEFAVPSSEAVAARRAAP
jgi:hypothetical protein